MHVFIDTNILLNFFHFSKDELDSLNNVFASHEQGSAVVHLTEQVRDEFRRNREAKIKDALKRFQDARFSLELPSFMKEYPEHEEIKNLSTNLQKKIKSIQSKADKDISNFNLTADKLIDNILKNSNIKEITQDCFEKSYRRMSMGNPPGKKGSIGDSINWEILLESVEDDKDLHIISADGDFYSKIREDFPDPFLKQEWEEKKKSKLFVYRTLSSFMKKHFDGVAFSFDSNKEILIDSLNNSGSFATTHQLISKLESYPYFSLREVQAILDAAKNNGQFGGIITDYDVLDFLSRVAVPHISNIKDESCKELLKEVIVAQKEREDDPL